MAKSAAKEMAETAEAAEMTAAAKTTGKSAATPGQQGSGAAGLPLPVNYEAALAELEELVARMEDGSLSLEASLAAYRRGAALVTFCQQQLEAVEQQVRVLDGETLKPLSTHPAGTLAAESGDDL